MLRGGGGDSRICSVMCSLMGVLYSDNFNMILVNFWFDLCVGMVVLVVGDLVEVFLCVV